MRRRFTGRRSTVRAVLTVAAAALTSAAFAAGDVEAGKVKFETCKGCHVSAGYKNSYPNYSVPKLFGQNVEYLIVALKAYRSGEREHPTMVSQASSMSDQDIEDVAAFIGSLSQ